MTDTPAGNGAADQIVDEVCDKAKAAIGVVMHNLVGALDRIIEHAESRKSVLLAKLAATEASIDHCVALAQDTTKFVSGADQSINAISQTAEQ